MPIPKEPWRLARHIQRVSRATHPVPPRGGAQYVTADQTLGILGGCWCGRERNHDWPGKAIGVPHPREEERGAMSTQLTSVTKGDLKGFHKVVSTLLMELINKYEVRYRWAAHGAAILLYPPDGKTQPLRLSKTRPADMSEQYLLSWAQQHLGRDKGDKGRLVNKGTRAGVEVEFAEAKVKTEVDETDVQRLAARLNGPEHRPERKTEVSAQPVEDEPAVTVPVKGTEEPTEEALQQAADEFPDDLPDGWEPVFAYGGKKYIGWAEKDGKFWCMRCRAEGVETYKDKRSSLGGHIRAKHTPEAKPLWVQGNAAKARQEKRAQTMAAKKAAKKTKSPQEKAATEPQPEPEEPKQEEPKVPEQRPASPLSTAGIRENLGRQQPRPHPSTDAAVVVGVDEVRAMIRTLETLIGESKEQVVLEREQWRARALAAESAAEEAITKLELIKEAMNLA